MKFRPLQDRVLVRRIEQEEKTTGGIIIPDTAKEKPMEGDVIAAGPGTRGDDGKLNPLDVKGGDRDQDRRRGPRRHEGERYHGHRRRAYCGPQGRVRGGRSWRQKKSGFIP